MADVIDGNGSDATAVVDGNNDLSTAAGIYDGNDVAVEIVIPPTPVQIVESRRIWLESMDGSTVIDLNGGGGAFLRPGATGLQLPPLDVVTSVTPGMPGSYLEEVNVQERPVFLPLGFTSSAGQADFFAKLAVLRSFIDWDDVTIGQTGMFRIGVSSLLGERLLDVVYKSGWEGTESPPDSGSDWAVFPLNLVAVDPYWRQRDPVELPFSAAAGPVFLGSGDGSNPWPRQISASTVIGSNMAIPVDGDVPVWPEIQIDGPVSAATVTYPGTSIVVPSGVNDSSTLVLVTDPRFRSARLDGAIAWSSITLGSTVVPLKPGVNKMSVTVGTSGAGTGLILRWTPGWKTPW
jgi:hypothetical protein